MNHNEPHIMLPGQFEFAPYLSLQCLRTDYAACQTIRLDKKEKFQLITGNAVVWCKKTGDVVFQKRKTVDVDWFPGAYSIWGGGFLPDSVNDKISDGHSIYNNIEREFMEETGNITHLKNLRNTRILVSQEHKAGQHVTGSLQFNALGAEIPQEAIGRLIPTWEGSIDYCNKKQLSENFAKNHWTPFAVASILIWLKITHKSLFERMHSIFKEKNSSDLLGLTGKALDVTGKAIDTTGKVIDLGSKII